MDRWTDECIIRVGIMHVSILCIAITIILVPRVCGRYAFVLFVSRPKGGIIC